LSAQDAEKRRLSVPETKLFTALERNRYVQDKFAPPGTRAGASKALLQARQNSSFLRFLFFGGRRTECQAESGATSV